MIEENRNPIEEESSKKEETLQEPHMTLEDYEIE